MAFAGPLDDAKALINEANELVSGLRSGNPAADAETTNRVQKEAVDKLREAQRLLERGGARTTSDAELAYAYGDLLVRLGDLDLAAGTLKNAFELAPENPDYALGYGTVLVQLGDEHAADAIEALRAVIALAPDSNKAASAYGQLAEIYRHAGIYELTLESAEQALAIDPEHSGSKFLKAVCLVRQGRFLEANTLMDEVAMKAPALAGDDHGRLYDAVRDFERRNLWVANTAEEHAAYGKMLIRVNRIPDSIDSLRHAVRLNPNDVVTWNLLGSVYRQANRIEDARDAFERSLATDPNQDRTREVLEQLPPAPAAAP